MPPLPAFRIFFGDGTMIGTCLAFALETLKNHLNYCYLFHLGSMENVFARCHRIRLVLIHSKSSSLSEFSWVLRYTHAYVIDDCSPLPGIFKCQRKRLALKLASWTFFFSREHSVKSSVLCDWIILLIPGWCIWKLNLCI